MLSKAWEKIISIHLENNSHSIHEDEIFTRKFYIFDMKMVWHMIKRFLRNFGLLKIQG